MSQSERRIRRIAIGLAVIALLTVTVAVVMTWRAGELRPARAAPVRHVSATDLARLKPGMVVQVEGGIRVTDDALCTALGLGRDDTIIAISGRPVAKVPELSGILRELGILRPRSLFIDLIRDRETLLERWEIDGDLDTARRAAAGAPSGPIDPLVATVKQLTSTTYEVPRATVEAWTADPTLVTSGGRGIPVLDPGVEHGFKLYAIRPGSVYAALGFQNGDVIRAINGTEITASDQILELVARSTRQITIDLVRRGQPILLNYLIK
jgi:membrane-associated protease RseP (regulator of RpoE activity)